MEYFRLLNLSKEPFSNSPDPEFFYSSREHVACLQKLELSIRLRRGLNVVIGDIGTGKTTLCRHLIRQCAADKKVETHLILDPHFLSPLEFLATLAEMFGLTHQLQTGASTWQIKESMKNYLFKMGVEEKRTVVLVIDEGQKIPEFCLEILRELLNYETNEHKLLQIVIFAQTEFHQTITEHPNFSDRINFYHILGPLNFRETRNLLKFRLNQAKDSYKNPKLFTFLGLLAVYRATGGYPRKIIHLCHSVLMTMIIQNRTKAGWSLVRWCSKMLFPGEPFQLPWAVASVFAGVLVILVAVAFPPEQFEIPFFSDIVTRIKTVSIHHEEPASLPAPKRFKVPVPLNTVMPDRVASNRELSNSELGEPQNTIVSAAGQAAPAPAERAVSHDVLPQTMPQTSATEAPAQPSGTSPATPPAASTAGSYPPDILGHISLRPGDSLEQMIRKVYGFFDQQYLKAVMQINPQMNDSNNIEVGRSIDFPPLPVRSGNLPKNGRWVLVAEKTTLEDAYKLLRAYPRSAPPISILPYWNARNGLRFGIMVKDCCVDQQSAELALRELPSPLASGAKILNKWDEDLVFIAK